MEMAYSPKVQFPEGKAGLPVRACVRVCVCTCTWSCAPSPSCTLIAVATVAGGKTWILGKVIPKRGLHPSNGSCRTPCSALLSSPAYACGSSLNPCSELHAPTPTHNHEEPAQPPCAEHREPPYFPCVLGLGLGLGCCPSPLIMLAYPCPVTEVPPA